MPFADSGLKKKKSLLFVHKPRKTGIVKVSKIKSFVLLTHYIFIHVLQWFLFLLLNKDKFNFLTLSMNFSPPLFGAMPS